MKKPVCMYIFVQLKTLLLQKLKPDTIKKLCVTENAYVYIYLLLELEEAHDRQRRYRPDGGMGAATWCPAEKYALYIDNSKTERRGGN
jgi:hypothetical protein